MPLKNQPAPETVLTSKKTPHIPLGMAAQVAYPTKRRAVRGLRHPNQGTVTDASSWGHRMQNRRSGQQAVRKPEATSQTGKVKPGHQHHKQRKGADKILHQCVRAVDHRHQLFQHRRTLSRLSRFVASLFPYPTRSVKNFMATLENK